MKAIQSAGASVTCDHCDFEVEVKDIKEYLNKQCPKCDATDMLITNEDIKTHDAMMGLMNVMNEIVGDSDTSEEDMIKVSVKITDGEITGAK